MQGVRGVSLIDVVGVLSLHTRPGLCTQAPHGEASVAETGRPGRQQGDSKLTSAQGMCYSEL